MSERMTTIVSALLALGILGLGVTAQPTGDPADARIESLESDVRFQIEMSWRHDGRTRTARQAELEATLDAFDKSPQSVADRQLLEKWLRGAVVASLPGESGEFPVTPTFGEAIESAAKPASGSPAPAVASVNPAAPPAVKQTQLPPRDVQLKPAQAYTPPRAKEIRLTPRSHGVEQAQTPPAAPPQRIVAAKPVVPAEPESQPAAKPTPSPSRPAVAAAPRLQAPQVIENGALPVQRPETKPVELAAPALVETPPTLKPANSAASSALPLPGNAQPVEELARQPQPQQPAIAAKPPATPPAVEPEPVTVNLAELNAQIRGYHEGLHEIDAKIVAKRGKLSEGEIAQLVGLLEQLSGQHAFVRLYYDGLSKSERRFVGAPRSMADTINLVQSELETLNAADEDFLTSLEGAAEEDELARRLDDLSKAAEPDDSPPTDGKK